MTPEITTLGNTLAEALELQKAHDDVLQQLQVIQSKSTKLFSYIYTQESLQFMSLLNEIFRTLIIPPK